MNSNSANNQNSQWQIDRYLLSDPSLDRDAFEKQMLEDLSLAEQVAASVADLQALSAAARASVKPQWTVERGNSKKSTSPKVYRWAAILTAAVVLMALSIWQFDYASDDDQLSQIADSWAAFEGLTTAESLEWIATQEQPAEDSTREERPGEEQFSEIQADAESNSQSDWLVEAAREFYLAQDSEAAG